MKGKKTGGRRPGSKNKVPPEIKAIALAMVPNATTTLRSLLKDASDAVKIRAVEIVYERAFGKPKQAVEHSGAIGSYDLTKLSDDKLRELAAILGSVTVADGDYEGDQEA